MRGRATLAVAVVALLLPGPVAAQDVLDLQIGDPGRRDKRVPLVLDGIIDTRDGALLSPRQLAARLDGVRLLLVGESHTANEIHRSQAGVVRALIEHGRPLLVGLEMFPVTQQAALDLWNEGADGRTFVEGSGWYEHWGYHWGYYEEIFRVARAGGARLVALNAPRASVTAVRTRGYDALEEDERIGLAPAIDTDSAEHLQLFKAYLGDGAAHGGVDDAQWAAMFAAQVTWDAAMAYNAARALEAHADPHALMVVMVGSGHVAYGLGIARQAARYLDGDVATLIPVAVEDDNGRPVDAVRGSYADFVWGVPGEHDTHYPSLGASIRDHDGDGARLLFVDPDGAAAAAGLRAGDVVVAMDGATIDGREGLSRRLAALGWGASAELEVRRDDTSHTLEISFRRRR